MIHNEHEEIDHTEMEVDNVASDKASSELKQPPSPITRTSSPPMNQKRKRNSNMQQHANDNAKERSPKVLTWLSPQDYVPLASEEAMICILLHWGRNERGMIKDHPPFRLAKIKKQLQKVSGITLHQALSLRRHHMKLHNSRLSLSALKLGVPADVQESARIFEDAVDDFLKSQQIIFWTEEEQKQRFEKTKQKGELLKATPDFLLQQPAVLQRVSGRAKRRIILDSRTIHWIEAKMFYGASTIPHGTPNAVGTILKKAKKYVALFGQGAMVFSQGCGSRLAADLAEIGVTAMDCSGTVSSKRVQEHQRTWCGNERGEILP